LLIREESDSGRKYRHGGFVDTDVLDERPYATGKREKKCDEDWFHTYPQ
jgi:hypothetical protein